LLGLGTPLAAQSDYATPYTFNFLAGTPGSSGSLDGTGAAALFDQPYGVALDSSGNLFVADKGDHTIRMITSAGVVTTIAGTAGSSGTTDGTGSAARFNGPTGVAVGSGGAIYVADSINNTIRKIASAAGGVVTTLAGAAGTAGSTNGTGTAATFNQPYGVAIDSSGNVYVAEFGNNLIRMVTQGGVVTTVAGTAGVTGSADGTSTAAMFNGPIGIAVDGSGNLYVADSGNNTIRKITSSGVVTTIAGTPGVVGSADGTGSAALFSSPTALAIDATATFLYVADTNNATVRRITIATGEVDTIVGSAAAPILETAPGALPATAVGQGVALDATHLYLATNDALLVTPY